MERQSSDPIAPILVVDDSPEDLALLERLLRQCKLLNPVVAFNSGASCVQYFRDAANSSAPHPVLVLLDLIMAPMCGLEVMRQLQAMSVMERTCVVMLSGIRNIKSIHEGYQLGAHTFLIKPVTAEDIVQVLSGLTRIDVVESADGYVLAESDGRHGERQTSFFRRKPVAFSA